jgi:hypothetical protein
MNRSASKQGMESTYLNAQKWTIVSVHPEVRELVDGDDEHFTGYKGLQLNLEYPREFYGVIGSCDAPLRLVRPGDWVITRSNRHCISMSEKWVHEYCPDLIR